VGIWYLPIASSDWVIWPAEGLRGEMRQCSNQMLDAAMPGCSNQMLELQITR
jgi:hypothetical protein